MEKKQIFENGQVVGAFTVVREVEPIYRSNGEPRRRWRVKCNLCENYRHYLTEQIRKFKSCGCLRKPPVFSPGQVVGNFTIIQTAGTFIHPDGTSARRWLVECNHCGKYVFILTAQVKQRKSCGCLRLCGKLHLDKPDIDISLIMSSYMTVARKADRPFDLTYEQFKSLIFSDCAYCGQSIDESGSNFRKSRHKGNFQYHGIDRINNDLGYTIDNCVPACYFCNRAKNKHSLDFFLEKCRAVAEIALARGGD